MSIKKIIIGGIIAAASVTAVSAFTAKCVSRCKLKKSDKEPEYPNVWEDYIKPMIPGFMIFSDDMMSARYGRVVKVEYVESINAVVLTISNPEDLSECFWVEINSNGKSNFGGLTKKQPEEHLIDTFWRLIRSLRVDEECPDDIIDFIFKLYDPMKDPSII